MSLGTIHILLGWANEARTTYGVLHHVDDDAEADLVDLCGACWDVLSLIVDLNTGDVVDVLPYVVSRRADATVRTAPVRMLVDLETLHVIGHSHHDDDELRDWLDANGEVLALTIQAPRPPLPLPVLPGETSGPVEAKPSEQPLPDPYPPLPYLWTRT